jgi:uncharacterized membrane protein
VERFVASTVAYLPPEEAYEFLLDFPGYANYSKHLRAVDQRGDGGPGTRYRLRFAWWKLTYTAHSRVTEVRAPERIDWEVTKDLHAEGRWEIEPVEPPAGEDHATEVRFVVEYEPDTVHAGILDLPALVSMDWVVGKVMNLIREEGERVVERIVADLEGESRPVEVDVRYSSVDSP